MKGLEVKVRLGTVWKQSLTELSGGQRCVSYLHSPFVLPSVADTSVILAPHPFFTIIRVRHADNATQVSYRALPHHVPAAVQARADVHSGRD